MKSALFLVAPIFVTLLNIGFAMFLNHRHSHAHAMMTPEQVKPMSADEHFQLGYIEQ
jgi:hypothetical protein